MSLEREVVESKNKGQFFRFLNSKMGRKQGVGILKNDAGEMLVTDQEKANSLNRFSIQSAQPITEAYPNYLVESIQELNLKKSSFYLKRY